MPQFGKCIQLAAGGLIQVIRLIINAGIAEQREGYANTIRFLIITI
jgi:hypothetical protein